MTPFVIYSRKERPITRAMLDAAMNESPFPYRIETDRGHVMYFPFKTFDSSAPHQSLMKVKLGRIDAFIFAQQSTDEKVLELGLERDLHRALYQRFDVRFVIPKSDKGKDIDRILTSILDTLSATGELQRLNRMIEHPEYFVETLERHQQ